MAEFCKSLMSFVFCKHADLLGARLKYLVRSKGLGFLTVPFFVPFVANGKRKEQSTNYWVEMIHSQ